MKILMIILFITPFVNFGQALVPSKATFGRYSENCLGGRGLCSFTTESDMRLGNATVQVSSGTLLLTMKRAILRNGDEISISGKDFNRFASGEKMTFLQQDAMTLDAGTLRRLGINPDHNTIVSGEYPLTIDSETVTVAFKLAAAK